MGQEKEPKKVNLDVPHIRQRGPTCAAFSLKMVLEHWGIDAPKAYEIYKRLGGTGKNGLSFSKLAYYSQSIGAHAVQKCAPDGDRGLGMLKDCAKANIPVIVSIYRVGANAPHAMVVRGFRGNKILINDPARGKESVNTAEFLHLWGRRNYNFLIVTPSGHPIPSSALSMSSEGPGSEIIKELKKIIANIGKVRVRIVEA